MASTSIDTTSITRRLEERTSTAQDFGSLLAGFPDLRQCINLYPRKRREWNPLREVFKFRPNSSRETDNHSLRNNNSYQAIQDVLSFSSEPIQSSLLKMRPAGQKAAAEMFSRILNWMTLSNGDQDREERLADLDEFLSAGKFNCAMKNELYLQLIKQTRNNPDPSVERNAWKLFGIVASNMRSKTQSPPQNTIHAQRDLVTEQLSHLAIAYAKSVVFDYHRDPRIRQMAYDLLNILVESSPGKNSAQLHAETARQFSREVFSCKVYFMDGTAETVYYDSRSVAADVVQQIAWVIGLNNCSAFGLYEWRGDRHLPIKPESSLADMCAGIQRRNRSLSVLLMKRIGHTMSQSDRANPAFLRLAFVQAREEYLKGDYPVDESDITRLCFLQLYARYGRAIFYDEATLFQFVPDCMRPKHLGKRRAGNWARQAIQCLRRDCPCSKTEAQQQFIDKLNDLPFKDCVFVPARKKSNLADGIPSCIDLFVGANEKGIHLFQRDELQHLQSFSLDDVLLCSSTCKTLSLVVKRSQTDHRYEFITQQGKELCEEVHRYKQDCGKDFEQMLTNAGASFGNAASLSLAAESAHDHKTTETVGVAASDNVYRGKLQAWCQAESSSCFADRRVPCKEYGRLVRPDWSEESVEDEASSSNSSLRQPRDAAAHCPSSTVRSNWTSCCPGLYQILTQRRPNMKNARRPDLVYGMKKIRESFPCCLHQQTSSGEITSEYDVLSVLSEGDIFAKRYRIESDVSETKPHIRYATHIYTEKRVVLKFYSSRFCFENAMYLHRYLRSRHICSLEDVIEGDGRYPPCLIYERGDLSLAEWMLIPEHYATDRKAALFQVLKALTYIHNHQVVHGDLKPGNIMWFTSEHTWKLLDLDTAALSNDLVPINYTMMYAAPEIIQGEERGKERLRLDTAADMWSFGIIAFEVLTGKRFYGSGATIKLVREYLRSRQKVPSIGSVNEKQARKLIAKLLEKDPKKRLSARKASRNAIFRSAEDSSQKEARLHRVEEMQARMLKVTQNVADEISLTNVTASIGLEAFVDGDGDSPFHSRKGEAVLSMVDDSMQEEPIFMLNLDKDYRLRVTLQHRHRSEVPFEKVAWIAIKPPDSESIRLDMTEYSTPDGGLEAVALMEAKKHRSKKLSSKSPLCGGPEEKYVSLDVLVGVVTDSENNETVEMKETLFCRMHDASEQFRAHKLWRCVKQKWIQSPQWMKDSASGLKALANAAGTLTGFM